MCCSAHNSMHATNIKQQTNRSAAAHFRESVLRDFSHHCSEHRGCSACALSCCPQQHTTTNKPQHRSSSSSLSSLHDDDDALEHPNQGAFAMRCCCGVKCPHSATDAHTIVECAFCKSTPALLFTRLAAIGVMYTSEHHSSNTQYEQHISTFSQHSFSKLRTALL